MSIKKTSSSVGPSQPISEYSYIRGPPVTPILICIDIVLEDLILLLIDVLDFFCLLLMLSLPISDLDKSSE
jgi:hypothetical protein